MNSRFNRRSSNSPRSKRPGARRIQGNDGMSGKSPRRQPAAEERGAYRTNDLRGQKRRDRDSGSFQGRRELSRQEGDRPNRPLKDRKYVQENEKQIPGNSSIPRRLNSRGSFARPSRQSPRMNSSWTGNSINQKLQADKPMMQKERFSSSNEIDPIEHSFSTDMLWGRHSTQAALEARRPIHRIWCTSELRSSQRFLQLLRDAKSSGVLVEEVTWARLGQLTNGAVHQGIAIQTAAAETLDLSTLIEGCSELSEPSLLLALDGLTDPQNLGAIVRSAEAFGAHGMVLPQRRSAGLTGSVSKVAAGALEHLPVARVVNLNRSLETLKHAGYRVIGLAEEGNETLSEVDLEGPLVVVTGSEGKGISLVTRRHCDHLVRIPLRGVTPSLNASVATAVFLYEVARRGWMKDLSGQDPSPRMVRAKCASVSIESEESALLKEHKSEKVLDDIHLPLQPESKASENKFKNGISLNSEGDSDSDPFNQSITL